MPLYPARSIQQSINRPWREVYDFASDPQCIHLWASGLATALQQTDDPLIWLADGGPVGKITIEFCEKNTLGIIDHQVTMPDGQKIYNALRLSPNGSGTEVCFLLLQTEGMSDRQFEVDAHLVAKDLSMLRLILESGR